MGLDVAAGLVEIELRQRRVVRAGPGHQHVVDRRGQVLEERPEPFEVGGVEGLDALRVDLGRGALEPRLVAAGQDDVGALGAGAPGGFESNARAPANDDDGLPEQLRFPRTCHRAAAISARSAFSASA